VRKIHLHSFSLLEALLAVAILAASIIPLLSARNHALEAEAKAQHLLRESMILQNAFARSTLGDNAPSESALEVDFKIEPQREMQVPPSLDSPGLERIHFEVSSGPDEKHEIILLRYLPPQLDVEGQ
jgi:hypothetical protein